MDSFKIRMHNSQSDNQDIYGSNPQKMGSENLNNLSGYVLVEHWLWVKILFAFSSD